VRIAVVVNGAAGTVRKAKRKRLIRALAEPFERHGHRVRLVLAEGRDIGRAVEAACLDAGVDAVVLGGGDGTLSRALGDVVSARKIIGVLPLGTMNYVARELGLPRDPVLAAESLAQGEIRRIDAGRVNGQLFLIRACLGMLPEYIRGRDTVRHGGKKAGFLDAVAAGVAAVVARYPVIDATLRWGDQTRRVMTPFLMVSCNLCVDSAPMRLERDRLDGGRLAVYFGIDNDPLALMRQGVGAVLGQWQSNDDMERFAMGELAVDVAEKCSTLISLDGEAANMVLPLRFDVLPGAVSILAARTLPW
jgi:diacylglycerol kinase family enzyme